MTRKVLTLLLASFMLLQIPVSVYAGAAIEMIETDLNTPTVTVVQSSVHISGAAGQTLQIYNVAGICVLNVKIDSPDTRIDLNLQKGCYILKIGKIVRKISIK